MKKYTILSLILLIPTFASPDAMTEVTRKAAMKAKDAQTTAKETQMKVQALSQIVTDASRALAIGDTQTAILQFDQLGKKMDLLKRVAGETVEHTVATQIHTENAHKTATALNKLKTAAAQARELRRRQLRGLPPFYSGK